MFFLKTIKVLTYALPLKRLICFYGGCKWQQWRRVNVDSQWRRLAVIDLFPKLADFCRWRIVLDLCAPPFRPILLSSVKNMIACSLFSICQKGFQLFKLLHYPNPQSSSEEDKIISFCREWRFNEIERITRIDDWAINLFLQMTDGPSLDDRVKLFDGLRPTRRRHSGWT